MSILILYGSETGTAQDISESLRRESEMRHVSARVMEMDDFDMENLKNEKIVILVVSTTGQGEMPPNMRESWRFLLRKSLPVDFLKNVYAGVVGLGDSSYQKYNFAGKKLFRRLVQLGAKMITEVCLADDQHQIGLDGALVPWREHFWKTLYHMNFFSNMTSEVDLKTVIEPKYSFEDVVAGEKVEKVDNVEISDFFGLRVEKNTRLTSDSHFQDTRLVRFGIKEEDRELFRYRPGDVLMVRPYNLSETVKIAIDSLGYSDELLDKAVRIVPRNVSVRPPPYYLLGKVTTLRICLERFFDLQRIPTRSFFETLSYYSENPAEKERLAELSSPEGFDDLLDYANRSRRTIAETLQDFRATAKNLLPNQLFEIFTAIRPRAFSIASAPCFESVELLVAKVEYTSRMSMKRKGLCSSFISRLRPNDEVFCKVRRGTFLFPPPEKPVLCIGPGTGVAPFRSLFGYRSQISGTSHSTSLLFFGCRSKLHDYYFDNEWSQLEGVEVVTAFSRDGEKKIYVQHKMGEYAPKIRKLLDQGAHVFIAGSSGDMPKAVSAVLRHIKGDVWTANAEASGKIQYETWS